MYNYLKGILIRKDENKIIVENNGIGYEIFTSINSIQEFEENSEVKIFTRLVLKDEGIFLIGFSGELELEIFELLNSVSGVGIKSALNILNTVNVKILISVIAEEDFKVLTTVPGVGKKTAQRIIIDLKDKFEKKYVDSSYGFIDKETESVESKGKRTDIRLALQSLGYSSSEINMVLNKLDIENDELDILLKEALKLLMKI